jgi:hypothetical protein
VEWLTGALVHKTRLADNWSPNSTTLDSDGKQRTKAEAGTRERRDGKMREKGE